MARTRRRAQRQGWGGGVAHPLPSHPRCGIPRTPAGRPCTLRTRSPWDTLGVWPWPSRSQGSTYAWAHRPFLAAHGDIGRGITPPFLFNLFFSLYHCSSRGGFSRADTPPGVTPPTPVPWHCCQDPPPPPALAQTDRRVGPGCGGDRQRGTGGAALRGLHARAGKCCAGAVTCEPPKLGWGGRAASGSSW